MSIPKNNFYSKTIEEFFRGKDSTMEMAKVISYDRERLVAKVFTLTSKQSVEDVPVFFPSMFLNTGIIAPPVRNSTSLLFWGSDKQPFLLPIQLTVPNIKVTDGLSQLNASPGFFDEALSLKNIQGGEQLFRSLGGAYLFLKNLGDVEIGTKKLHKVSLTEKDGTFETLVERLRSEVGNSNFYFGPASRNSNNDSRTHFKFELDEQSDKSQLISGSTDEEIVTKILQHKIDEINISETPKIFNYQLGTVFDETQTPEVDTVDGTELFSKQEFYKDGITRVETLSKGGRKTIETSSATTKTTVAVSNLDVNVSQERVVDGVVKKTHIGIDDQGNITCGKDGVSYDLWAVIKWFYEERTI